MATIFETSNMYSISLEAADLGISIDLKSADKELKVVTHEKSKICVTVFTKRLVTTFQLSRTRKSGR